MWLLITNLQGINFKRIIVKTTLFVFQGAEFIVKTTVFALQDDKLIVKTAVCVFRDAESIVKTTVFATKIGGPQPRQ